MSRDPARAATQFFGGRVCLDFANTMDWRTSDAPQRAAAAAAFIDEAHALRGEIWKAAEALCRGDHVHLAPFNRRLEAAPAQPRLVRDGAGYVHDLPGAVLEEVLWPVKS